MDSDEKYLKSMEKINNQMNSNISRNLYLDGRLAIFLILLLSQSKKFCCNSFFIEFYYLVILIIKINFTYLSVDKSRD